MDDALEILARNPSEEFSNRDLQRLTGYGGPSVSKALSLLKAMELIVRRNTGNRTLYRIDEQRLRDADDPFLEIPQAEFREPLKRFRKRIDDQLSSVLGIVCFGSVARGEADRPRDVDVFVLVDDKEMVSARRTVSDVVRDLEEESIGGDRYEFEVFVESPESARNREANLQPIFQEGIPSRITTAVSVAQDSQRVWKTQLRNGTMFRSLHLLILSTSTALIDGPRYTTEFGGIQFDGIQFDGCCRPLDGVSEIGWMAACIDE